nr:hypothetical protein [uncultured Capnocytophaga sp.]
MKTKILLLLAFSFIGSFVYAQEKDISGNYRGRGGGIMLLPNKLFVLWGYMTAVPGSYEVQKDGIILFKPKKEPLFVVYGQRNDSIGKDKVRIRFANFEDGKNYIRFENGKTYSVFNDNPNCFSSRYIHTFPREEMGNFFSLIADLKRLEFVPFLGELRNTYQIDLQDNNDFLISYQELTEYQIDGAGALVTKEGYDCLLFFNQADVEGSTRLIRELKKEIDKIPIEELKGVIFAKEKSEDKGDKELKDFLSISNLEEPKAFFMNIKEGSVDHNPINRDFLAYDKDKNIYKDTLNDIEYYRFDFVQPKCYQTDLEKLKVEPKTIFVSECEKPSKRRIYQ